MRWAFAAIWLLTLVGAFGLTFALVAHLDGPAANRANQASEPLPVAVAETPASAAPMATASEDLTLGKALYQRHCLQCHGETGNGLGIAAVFLYPKPRNFQEAKYKLVSTANRIPTDDDLKQAIARGMPGSVMLPFGHLRDAELDALVAYVRHLTRAGIEARLKKAYEEAGDEVDAATLARESAKQTTPGEVVALPKDCPERNAAAIQRGKALYLTNCATCHGETGRGEGGKDQRDDDGTPTKPRDFTLGIFKGGRTDLALYHRLQIGMPGTPMPATPHLKPTDLMDMVYFIQSLAPEAAQAKVEHRRQKLVAHRVQTLDEAAWSQAPAAFVVTTPLWWRDWASPDLTVRILHDGRQVGVRLTWKDPTKDDVILKADDFEDQASVQFFAGDQEPFIGMGAHGFGVVDIWSWRASQSRDQTAPRHLLDDYPFDLPFYHEFLKRLPPARRPPPDFRTARAAGNQLNATPEGRGAAALTAAGPGSTTFRPKSSQFVEAKATHTHGQWTVTLTRPLSVPEGTTFTAGKSYFLAFSLWDGASRDRNGQKQISIWHMVSFE